MIRVRTFRASDEDYARWQRLSVQERKGMSDWIRRTLNEAADSQEASQRRVEQERLERQKLRATAYGHYQMIWLAPLLAWAVVGAFIVKTQPRWSRHDECLKNIGRLESELFPELPKELRWAKWPMSPSEPGAIISIPTTNYTQMIRSFDALRNPKSQWHPVGAGK